MYINMKHTYIYIYLTSEKHASEITWLRTQTENPSLVFPLPGFDVCIQHRKSKFDGHLSPKFSIEPGLHECNNTPL